jgi:hypothetical protein
MIVNYITCGSVEAILKHFSTKHSSGKNKKSIA